MSKFKPLTLRHILIFCEGGEGKFVNILFRFVNRHMVHNDDDEKLQEYFAHIKFVSRSQNHLSSWLSVISYDDFERKPHFNAFSSANRFVASTLWMFVFNTSSCVDGKSLSGNFLGGKIQEFFLRGGHQFFKNSTDFSEIWIVENIEFLTDFYWN